MPTDLPEDWPRKPQALAGMGCLTMFMITVASLILWYGIVLAAQSIWKAVF